MTSQFAPRAHQLWLPFKCAEAVPAFGVVVPDPATPQGYVSNGQRILAVVKATGPSPLAFVNGPCDVPANVPGSCTMADGYPTEALVDVEASSELSPGDRVGVVDDSWELSLSSDGFMVVTVGEITGGTVTRYPTVVRVQMKPLKGRLTANLDAGGSATIQPQKLNKTSKEYADDTGLDELTVYDTQGSFCGVEGEVIEYLPVPGDGETIWEVVRGGAMYQTGTLAEQLTHGETVSVNISGRSGVSVEATDIFLPDAYSGTTPIGLDAGTLVSLNYNTRPDSPRWEVTGAPGDQCETCPDPCV